MRFYVPEWDDAVDSGYDFEHDELSSLHRPERNLDYVWDIFDKETTPIDGVLISREQVEESQRKRDRLLKYGVHKDPVLSIPDWLPTISDCGAWGYKSLPFPPYGNAEMLDFYEVLDVSVGVTIDHLVLGSGKDKGRLYLDERAFHKEFKKSDLPDHITQSVDLMIDEWEEQWPTYIAEYEPSLWAVEDSEVALQVNGDVLTVRPNTATTIDVSETEPTTVSVERNQAVQLTLHPDNAVRVFPDADEVLDVGPGSSTAITCECNEQIRIEADDHTEVRVEPDFDSRIDVSQGNSVAVEIEEGHETWLCVAGDSQATLCFETETPLTFERSTASPRKLIPDETTKVTVDPGEMLKLATEETTTTTITAETSAVRLQTNAVPKVRQFKDADFEGDLDSVLNRLADDPRAVYRRDDKQFRYDLTLQNAREMQALYEEGDYPFRLMVAVQGWTAESYVEAAREVLELGYGYVGIGGVAGSPIHDVRAIVKEVGKTITSFERQENTRIDTHVFGFAKSKAFETIGRSGMTSFDSASMLRSAWTGGENYRLTGDERYDAIRVRYPKPTASLSDAVETTLRGRELLEALRAYAKGESIPTALREWEASARRVLPATAEYLQKHRHDAKFDEQRLRDIEIALREDFRYGAKLQAYFSEELRDKLVKNLRRDSADDPIPFDDYLELLGIASSVFAQFPRMGAILDREEQRADGMDSYEQLWFILQDYATWMEDDDLLEAYQKTIEARPWERCDCPICDSHGVEVCIFRGNDRNRRRGFHNTRKFYDEFSEDIPKTLIAIRGSASLEDYPSVEAYLKDEVPEFWDAVHDLPVAEIAVIDANGVYEWFTESPNSVSSSSRETEQMLNEYLSRYQQCYLYDPVGNTSDEFGDSITGCELTILTDPTELRKTALAGFGVNYAIGEDFLPHPPQIETASDLDILIIDQCSGSKYVPEGVREFEDEDLQKYSKEELLSRDNVRGIAARDLYTGRQQESISQAVRQLREANHHVDRYFISAGFGLVDEYEKLPPYEVTFSSMRVGEIRQRSQDLGIKRDLEQVLADSEYDFVFFALGKDYYTSIDIDDTVQQVRADRIGVVFNRDLVDRQFDNIVSVPARTDDAKRHGTIVIGLKGLYLENFAKYLSKTDTVDPETISKLCRHVDEGPTQAGIEKF